jgi:SAM-dependent methyltransferase
VKNLVILNLFILLISSCSTVSGRRSISSINASKNQSCKWTVNTLILHSLSPIERAKKLYTLKASQGLKIHLDLGGEGRYLDAINVNPQPYTSTTGDWGREIPFWVKGRSDEIPFPDKSIDKITIENAPINALALKEILRVLRPRGNIHLSHPEDYAISVHQMISDAFPNAEISSKIVGTNLVTKISYRE